MKVHPPQRRSCFHSCPFANWLVGCWLVGSSAGLHKHYWTDFRNTLMGDGSLPRIDCIQTDQGILSHFLYLLWARVLSFKWARVLSFKWARVLSLSHCCFSTFSGEFLRGKTIQMCLGGWYLWMSVIRCWFYIWWAQIMVKLLRVV